MRIVLVLLGFCVLLLAKEIEAEYKVSYGIFGSVGKSWAKMEANESNYTIEVVGKATGLAKILSNSRVERYTSQGFVKNGLFHPLLFIKIRQNSYKKDVKKFIFDYKKRRITIERHIYKNGKPIQHSFDRVPFFADEDILTLYFNIRHYLKPQKYFYTFKAVGGDRHTGRIDVIVEHGKRLRELQKLLGVHGLYLSVILHQKIFASKQGELHITIDKDGVAKKALLKDVIAFGDIVGVLVRKRIVE